MNDIQICVRVTLSLTSSIKILKESFENDRSSAMHSLPLKQENNKCSTEEMTLKRLELF